MYVSNNHHSRPSGSGEFQDPDLTPKPLRIAKQGSLRKSESVNTSRILSASVTNRASIPTRTSSVSSASTQSDLPPPDQRTKASQWVKRDTSLHLDKRRRGHSVSASTDSDARSKPSELSSSSKPLRQPNYQGISNAAGFDSGNNSVQVKARVTSEPTAARAFSTKSEKPPPAPYTPPTSQIRVMTEFVPIRGRIEATKNEHDKGLRGQPTSKRGFITRVMSNLTLKSRSDSAIAATEANNGEHTSDTNMLISKLQSPENAAPSGRTSDSSNRTGQLYENDLESVLTNFPTPPTSIETSPRISEGVSISQAEDQRYCRLRRPERASILGANLTLTAEHAELKSDGEESILIAIDIEGAIKSPPISTNDLWSQHTGLDIVVIIDNS